MMDAILVVRRVSSGIEHSIALSHESTLTIGRDATNDIQLPFSFVSSSHLCLSRRESGWFAVDLGSTNGTTLDGDRLIANQPVPFGTDQKIRIQDIELFFSSPKDQKAAPNTLAHSGTLVRRLIADGLSESVQDTAFLEVLIGPSLGERFYLPDHIEEFLVEISGRGIQEHDAPNARLVREGDGFALETELEVVLNQSTYLSGTRLRSGSRLHMNDLEFLFFDPLEEHLPEPEIAPKIEPEPVPSISEGEQPAPLDETTKPTKSGLSEFVVLGIAAFCLLLAAAVAMVFLL